MLAAGEPVVGEDHPADGRNNTAQQHEEGDQHFVHPANGQHNAHPGGGEGQRPATFAAQQMAGGGGDVIDGGAPGWSAG